MSTHDASIQHCIGQKYGQLCPSQTPAMKMTKKPMWKTELWYAHSHIPKAIIHAKRISEQMSHFRRSIFLCLTDKIFIKNKPHAKGGNLFECG